MKVIKKLTQKILGLFILIGILTGYSIEARPLKAKASQKTTQISRAKQTVRTKKSAAKPKPRARKITVKGVSKKSSTKVRNVAAQRKAKPSVRKTNAASHKKIPQKNSSIPRKSKKNVEVKKLHNKNNPKDKGQNKTKTVRNSPPQINKARLGLSNAPIQQKRSSSSQKLKNKVSLSKNGSVKKKQELLPHLSTRSKQNHAEEALKMKSPQQTFLDTKLVKVSHKRLLGDFSDESEFHACDVGYTNLPRTKQYSLLNLPAAPVFHPYNPIDSDAMKEYFLPAYTLNAKLPKVETSFLPKALQSVLEKELKTGTIKKVEAYVEVQDMPWLVGANGQIPLLLRPLYWCFPDEPNDRKEAYNNSFIVKTGLFSEKQTSPKLMGQKEEELVTQGLCIHNGGPHTPLVSSGNSLPVSGVIKTISHAFYSLTIHKDRAAITKHLILNHNDELEFEKLLKESTTLQDLKEKLLKNRKAFSNPEFADEFKDLWTFNQ